MQCPSFLICFLLKNIKVVKCVRSCLNHLWRGVSIGQFTDRQANIDTYYDFLCHSVDICMRILVFLMCETILFCPDSRKIRIENKTNRKLRISRGSNYLECLRLYRSAPMSARFFFFLKMHSMPSMYI